MSNYTKVTEVTTEYLVTLDRLLEPAHAFSDRKDALAWSQGGKVLEDIGHGVLFTMCNEINRINYMIAASQDNKLDIGRGYIRAYRQELGLNTTWVVDIVTISNGGETCHVINIDKFDNKEDCYHMLVNYTKHLKDDLALELSGSKS